MLFIAYLFGILTLVYARDCNEHLDVISESAWPVIQGYERALLDRAKLVVVGLLENYWPHVLLHTSDRRTYLRGNSTYFNLSSNGGAIVTRELTELRGRLVKDMKFSARSYSYPFIVILTADGSVFTAGWNRYGNLGHHRTTQHPNFEKVPGLPAIKHIAVSDDHCSVLTYKSMIYSWGNNADNRLGVVTSDGYSICPIKVDLGDELPQHICCGWRMCAVHTRNQNVLTWGWQNTIGRPLGEGNWKPARAHGLEHQGVTKVQCGVGAIVVRVASGRLYGWAENNFGMIGNITGGQPRASALNLDGKRVQDFTMGRYTTIIHTYSNELLYLGYSNGGYKKYWRSLGQLSHARDVLSRGYHGPDTWGTVGFRCDRRSRN